MASSTDSTQEYVPPTKATRDEADALCKDVDSILWIWNEDPERMTEIERINQEMLDKYPEEYRGFRNEILTEIQPQLETAYEKEKQAYVDKLDKMFARRLEDEKKKALTALKQDMEDEVKKSIDKEIKYAKRRKDMECKRAYAKIKNEITKAKMEGKKICLQCGKLDVSYGCNCGLAFYCHKTCFKQHAWIHTKYCTKSKTTD